MFARSFLTRIIPAFRFPSTVSASPLGSQFLTLSKLPLRASYHSSSAVFGKIKTKKAAAKRLLKTGKGDLKYGKAGKRHLNKHKSSSQLSRLGEKGILEGIWAKKMKLLVPY